MSGSLGKPEYEKRAAATRPERMAWWREARLGMFVHYGLSALAGRNEWVMSRENYPIAAYEKLADQLSPKPGAPGKLLPAATRRHGLREG
jgi:alpha-L-fucosidase